MLFKQHPIDCSFIIPLEICLTLMLIILHVKIKAAKPVFGSLILLHFFFLGVSLCAANNPLTDEHHVSNSSGSDNYIGVVHSHAAKTKWQELEIEMEYGVLANDSLAELSGKVILYNALENIQFELGDRIQFNADLQRIKANPNPHAFNYARYLFYRKITHSGFLSENAILHEKDQISILQKWANQCRLYCTEVLERWITNEESAAIAQAMLLGQRETLSKELNKAFVNTGSIHVLAVSGLHVGILSMIVLWLLNVFPSETFKVRIVKWIIYLACVWMFALVTGSGPAVMRASLMFSLYFSSTIFSKESSSFNSLAASAFLILLNDPYQLFSIGFQFSFLAICSILFFMPLVQALYRRQNTFMTYFLNLMALSFVAQIFVAPLSMTYFNQFALYFFISGLIAVPSAFVILCASVALVLFDLLFPPLNNYVIAPILNITLDILRNAVLYIQDFPAALIKDVYLDFNQMLLLIAVFVSMMFYFFLSKEHLSSLILFLFIFNAYGIVQTFQRAQQRICYVYNIHKETLIDFVLGDQCYQYASGGLDPVKITYAAKGNRVAHGIKNLGRINQSSNIDDKGLYSNHPFYQLGDTRIMIVDSVDSLYSDFGLDVHFLILANNVEVDLEMLLQDYLVHHVIIDGSISSFNRDRYVKLLDKLEIRYSFTSDQAYIIYG